MKIKGFAIDIDGTITIEGQGHTLDLEAVQMIRWLESLGFPVIISTGRGPNTAFSLTEYIDTCGVYVCENGGIIGKRAKTIVLGKKENAEKGLKVLKEKFNGEVVETEDYGTIEGFEDYKRATKADFWDPAASATTSVDTEIKRVEVIVFWASGENHTQLINLFGKK